jgi:hypothetical protein
MEQYEIQIGTGRTTNSVNVDEYLSINLKTNQAEILPYDTTSVIDVAQVFDDERQSSTVFRVYGEVDFISVVNGLKIGYNKLSDFYTRPRIGDEASGLTYNVLNIFDVYLCKQYTGHTAFTDVTGFTNQPVNYQRKYEVLTDPTTFEIYKSGYAKNIFNDQIYSFNFNVDIDIADQYDSFGKPLMDLYLLFNFKPNAGETIIKKIFDSGSTESINKTGHTGYQIYIAGDRIDGDLVFYDPAQFEELLINEMEYYCRFPCTGNTYLEFKYNPFIPITLRQFNDQVVLGSPSGTSEVDQNIPNYAVKLDNGNYVWEDILPYGYIDPISGRGVAHPFMNLRHYVFTPVTLSLAANLNNDVTATNFANMTFGPESILNAKPTSDLNKLGNKC